MATTRSMTNRCGGRVIAASAATADWPPTSRNSPMSCRNSRTPTGRTLSQAEREKLIDFADALDLPLIENSPYEMLCYVPAPFFNRHDAA